MKILGQRTLNRLKNSLSNQSLILMYHRVSNLKIDPWWLSVSPRNFDEHMQILNKYTQPIKLHKIGQKTKSFNLRRREVVVTFDDGYADNYKNASPILQKYEIPTTFFITTGLINKKEEFWWDEIGRLILSDNALPNCFDLTIAGVRYSWQIDSNKCEEMSEKDAVLKEIPKNNSILSRARLHYVIWGILKTLSINDKKIILELIRLWTGSSKEARVDHLSMTTQELQSLSEINLFEIGGHTVNHPMLSNIALKDQENEISESKEFLEHLLNRTITSFAYPHGEYSTQTLDILKRYNFTTACTVVPMKVNDSCDRYLLPRFGVLNWKGDEFERKINEWFLQ